MKKIKPDGSKTLYVGGIYEVDKNSGGSVTRTVTYYPAAGAMRIDNTLYYVLKDHLGSASVVTNADPLLPPPNSKEQVKMTSNISWFGFGGGSIESPPENRRRGSANSDTILLVKLD